MLRACISQGSWSIASASTSRCASLLHTSAILQAAAATNKSKYGTRSVKKINILKKAEREQSVLANRPSVVLGTRPSDEAHKWPSCDLAKLLVDEKELASPPELQPTPIDGVGTVDFPKQLSFGVGEAEKQMLFQDLPILTARPHTYSASPDAERNYQTAKEKEEKKATLFAKVLDLRNANAGGIAYENRRRIILAFSTPENPYDTGRSEVQAALLTYKIRNLWNHLTTFKRDVGNRRGLRMLVHQRAKVLRYLKRVDRDRYETVLERLALEPESVEGELVV
ncbi:hypothetical protein BDQ12DRAFT_625691 [Crucibulum laeve]|uniref:Ribosomal protein S15 n=1 Tax=Crucibulum laeve TaxID=68775 RepID=A0A5C3M8U1_9AGAR|nr:hypothetical protein BDQ12DRAFT_625691 [Crucibulum laeve]